MRRLLVAIVVLITLAVAGLVGLYYSYTCSLPPVAMAQLPPPAVQAGPPTNADGSPNWSARTLIDLAAAREQLWANTPIPYDTENPRYRQWAIDGFAAAEARAGQVKDRAGHFYTLAAYFNGFGDPHIQIDLKGDPLAPRWPGFIVSRAGDAAEIVYREPTDQNAPLVGAKITACDGKPIAALIDERVFPFRLNPKLASDRRIAVTRLFLDRGNPFAPAPAHCRVEHEGRAFDVTLGWRPAPPTEDKWWDAYRAASIGPDAPWGVSEPAPGVTWIGVPTFSSSDETFPKLDALIKAVEAKGAAMRQGRAIVIDTRGNGGGNSSWADKLAEAIFTPDVLNRHKPPPREEAVDWRGSQANAAYWDDWSEQMGEEFGTWSLNRFASLAISWQLGRTARQDPPMIRIGSCKPGRSGGITRQRPKGESPFPARVYFLSNGTCGSSCLNFADRVLMVPGVKVIGSATSADGAYMEVRSVDLPSGVAELTFPQKVERGAARAPMEAYDADIPHDGLWSDETVRAWVLARVAER